MIPDKFLVLRRDGTVPLWPSFVLGAADPAALPALEHYIAQCRQLNYDAAYIALLEAVRDDFTGYRERNETRRPDEPTRPRAQNPLVGRLLGARARGERMDLNQALAELLTARINEGLGCIHTWVVARLLNLHGDR